MHHDSILQLFINPPNNYRSIPFWSLNGRLNKEEIKRQIQGFAQIGLGGFFLHARDGLETEYLSDEWFECMKVAFDEAEKQGIGAWIYDDDRFPSGHAAGAVTAGHDEYLSRMLVANLYDSENLPSDKNFYSLYEISMDDTGILSCKHIQRAGQGKILALSVEVTKKSDWFNGHGAADLLNPKAVQRFLQVTHERYKQIAGEKFGETVPGVFTDEPALGAEIGYKALSIPWTTGFEEHFESRRGYSLKPLLPMIFFNHQDSPKIRHDFWRSVAERYDESFVKQCFDWCEENGVVFTGHFLDEANLGSMIRSSGNVMQHYRYQHMPAIDILGRNIWEYMTTCQVTSVARQFGNRMTLVENFGCTGWETSFEEQKRIIDWMLVNGIHIMCHHLFMYTVKGVAKYDFPSSYNYQNAGFTYQKLIEDYTARIGSVLNSGMAQRDIVVIHPVSSGWTMAGADSDSIDKVNEIGKRLNALLETLYRSHFICDLADETILEEHGSIKENILTINSCEYKVVILPELHSLFKNTFKLLLDFMNGGGHIISLSKTISHIEGTPADFSHLFNHKNMIVVSDIRDLVCKLDNYTRRSVSICDNYGNEDTSILCSLIKNTISDTLFVVNTDNSKSHTISISLSSVNSVTELNPLTGETKTPFDITGNTFSYTLPALGSALFILNLECSGNTRVPEVPPMYSTALPFEVKFSRSNPNVLVLDKCKYALDEEPFSPSVLVWQVHRDLHKRLDMARSFAWGSKPRYSFVNEKHINDGKCVRLLFEFTIESIPLTPVFAAVEEASLFQYTVNGKVIDAVISGHYLDRNINTVELENLVVGKNELLLISKYSQSTQLQNIFILGDFAVNTSYEITKEPDVLHAGDWCLQGYPFYAGEMRYSWLYECACPPGRTILDLSNVKATLATISVNSTCTKPVLGRFNALVDISDYVNTGTNLINISLVVSPRNVFGPFHVKREHDWADPGMFVCEGENYTDAYDVVPFGIMGRINIYK